MISQASSLKASLKRWMQTKTPWIADIYFYLAFPIRINFFRGVYPTYTAAEDAIDKKFYCGYDLPTAYPDSLQDLEVFRPINMPLRSHLQAALQEGAHVFDLGGGIGVDYYAFRKAITLPHNLKWQVFETPSAAAMGQQLAEQNKAPHLSFTTDLSTLDGADILLTNGALQYFETSLAHILSQIQDQPQHLLINYVPCYDGKTFFTVQNIEVSRCPYKIQNRLEFITEIEQLGYQLVTSWHDPRTCHIPFHRECFVNGYHGFYFVQATSLR